ncbi:MAG TPA: hypothetical protein VIK96_00675 [Bacilli bacterium]
MFKKLLLVFVAVFCILTLSSCKERTYKADGVYLAFDVGTTTPQITVVKVTIKNDKVESFYIDCLQSTAVKNTENVVTAYNFNAQSKKQLLYKYGMHNKDDQAADYTKQDLNTEAGLNAYKAYLEETGKKEWFQQAELMEAYFKTNGVPDDLSNVSSVTISDAGYTTLAKQALENAKAGKVYSWTYENGSTLSVIWAEGTVNEKGKLTSLKIDERQGKVTNGTFAWNAQTKQELQYLYGMHNSDNQAAGYTKQDLKTEAGLNAYKEFLEETGKKEWFQQAELLANYALSNGNVSNVTLNGTKLGDNAPEAIASVSINVQNYFTVMQELLDAWK